MPNTSPLTAADYLGLIADALRIPESQHPHMPDRLVAVATLSAQRARLIRDNAPGAEPLTRKLARCLAALPPEERSTVIEIVLTRAVCPGGCS